LSVSRGAVSPELVVLRVNGGLPWKQKRHCNPLAAEQYHSLT